MNVNELSAKGIPFKSYLNGTLIQQDSRFQQVSLKGLKK